MAQQQAPTPDLVLLSQLATDLNISYGVAKRLARRRSVPTYLVVGRGKEVFIKRADAARLVTHDKLIPLDPELETEE